MANKAIDPESILHLSTRAEWREWLAEHFATAKEAWLVFARKHSGTPSILYNDAVEEALCFGWIDSTIRTLDANHSMQWFVPRKNKNYYSTPNRERIRWLLEHNMVHPSVEAELQRVASEPFVFPPDIMERLQQDEEVWQHFLAFSEGYKRVRIGYLDASRSRPEEFEKRLAHFITKTRANKLIRGHGGIEKYY